MNNDAYMAVSSWAMALIALFMSVRYYFFIDSPTGAFVYGAFFTLMLWTGTSFWINRGDLDD